MRPRFRSASTDTSYDRRRGWRSVGRGAVATLLLVGILLVTVFAAQAASAAAPKMAKLTASGPLEKPDGGVPVQRGTSQSESLPPVVPGVTASPSGGPGVGAAGTIFYDGFEGSIASWTTAGGNDPTWAWFTYRPYAGSWSAYCAGWTGSGFNSPPTTYYNNMNAWLEAGPFNLSGVTSATLAFKLWLNSEMNYDWLYCMVSVDGQHYYGPGDSGNSQGWVDRSLDLTNVPTLGNVCGRSQVWIAFIFTSDASGTAEGAYVDEVSITGSGGAAARWGCLGWRSLDSAFRGKGGSHGSTPGRHLRVPAAQPASGVVLVPGRQDRRDLESV